MKTFDRLFIFNFGMRKSNNFNHFITKHAYPLTNKVTKQFFIGEYEQGKERHKPNLI